MGCKNIEEKISCFSGLEIRRISGDNVWDGNVIFYDSGKKLIVSVSASCQLFSVETGEHIKELFTCKTRIISLFIHSADQNLLVAVSEDGQITTYNFNTNKIDVICSLSLNAEHLNSRKLSKFSSKKISRDYKSISHNWDSEIVNNPKKRKFHHAVLMLTKCFPLPLIWATWSLKDEYHSHISAFSYKKGVQMVKVKLPEVPLKKCSKNFALRQTSDNNIVLVCLGEHFVYVCQYHNGSTFVYTGIVHKLNERYYFNCFDLSKREFTFVTGDSRGHIKVWKNIFSNNPLKELLQWHTEPVLAVALTSECSHIFSGGTENVLVKWSLLANQKNFLPRLPSKICQITMGHDSSMMALSLGDNQILIVDLDFHKISTIQYFSRVVSASSTKSKTKSFKVLTVDPRTDNLVLLGRPGHLQFVQPGSQCKFLYSVDIAVANYMTGDKLVVNTEVTHARFNRTGKWLVTAECRLSNVLKEHRLKFWHFEDYDQKYVLCTNMELSHGENQVLSLEISSDDVVASSGTDMQFKLWAPCQANDTAKVVWSLMNVGKYRFLPCNPLDFSKDGTLIAAGFGPSLTLWSTNSCELKCSLIPPFKREPLKFIKFGNDEHCHLIVTATESKITSWNIITLTMIWTVDLNTSYLVSDFYNSYMCAVSKHNKLFVFNPASPSSEFVLEIPSASPIIAACAFTSNDSTPHHLYLLNNKEELYCVKCFSDTSIQDTEEGAEGVEAYLTPFSSQMAEKTGGGVVTSISKVAPRKSKVNSNYVASILSAPSHTLPNPTKFSYDFLISLTISGDTRTKEIAAKQVAEKDDVVLVRNQTAKDTAINLVSEEKLWKTVNELFKA